MSAPGSIAIDRSGPETIVHIGHPPDTFTLTQLRMYAEYLATVAREAANPPPEPDVDALVAVLAGATEARYMRYEEALTVLARAALAAGYERKDTATGDKAA